MAVTLPPMVVRTGTVILQKQTPAHHLRRDNAVGCVRWLGGT